MIELTEKKYEQLRHDASIGQQLEGWICMHTHFTGEPPYVGTEGLLLALEELKRAAAKD